MFFVETASTKFLVDCGMFQGYSKNNALNEEEFPFNVEELDYIFLTHAHIDHSGRIPRIYIKGFRGQIIATKATVELCALCFPTAVIFRSMKMNGRTEKDCVRESRRLSLVYISGCGELFGAFQKSFLR